MCEGQSLEHFEAPAFASVSRALSRVGLALTYNPAVPSVYWQVRGEFPLVQTLYAKDFSDSFFNVYRCSYLTELILPPNLSIPLHC